MLSVGTAAAVGPKLKIGAIVGCATGAVVGAGVFDTVGRDVGWATERGPEGTCVGSAGLDVPLETVKKVLPGVPGSPFPL